ncbi:hypothetical protein HUU42_03895 [bacterium]|nr:hypothetical protein [bacterium]
MQAWIDTAREQAKKDERVEVSDIHIGKILGRSSTHNNIWPQEAVCYAIDRLNVDEIKRGFIIAVQNKRGASTHGPFEGGGQERDLAQSFRQKVSAIRDRWPITASLLETVAVHYDEEAKYHDNRAREADLKY